MHILQLLEILETFRHSRFQCLISYAFLYFKFCKYNFVQLRLGKDDGSHYLVLIGICYYINHIQ